MNEACQFRLELDLCRPNGLNVALYLEVDLMFADPTTQTSAAASVHAKSNHSNLTTAMNGIEAQAETLGYSGFQATSDQQEEDVVDFGVTGGLDTGELFSSRVKNCRIEALRSSSHTPSTEFKDVRLMSDVV